MKEYDENREKLGEIETIYEYNFKDEINKETIENPNPHGIIFYKSNLEAVFVQHNDLVAITTSIKGQQINSLLVDGGSSLSLLYLSYWSKMELHDEFRAEDIEEVASFSGSTSKIYG